MTHRAISFGDGEIEIAVKNGALHSVDLPAKVPEHITRAEFHHVMAILQKYPLDLDGVPEFTHAVWLELLKIPSGEVRSYAEVAVGAGRPRAFRAVGNACGANRCCLVIPCHRVVAKNGMGGFRYGLDWKQKLLELERPLHARLAA